MEKNQYPENAKEDETNERIRVNTINIIDDFSVLNFSANVVSDYSSITNTSVVNLGVIEECKEHRKIITSD